jgi:hypothetical protein
MAILAGLPPTPPPPPPSARYATSNPLRREYGLRLLTGNMPERLRRVLITAFRRPSIFNGQVTPLAIQSAHRQRPDGEALAQFKPKTLCWLTQTELGVTRRVLEAPLGSISRMTCNTLLVAQGRICAASMPPWRRR